MLMCMARHHACIRFDKSLALPGPHLGVFPLFKLDKCLNVLFGFHTHIFKTRKLLYAVI